MARVSDEQLLSFTSVPHDLESWAFCGPRNVALVFVQGIAVSVTGQLPVRQVPLPHAGTLRTNICCPHARVIFTTPSVTACVPGSFAVVESLLISKRMLEMESCGRGRTRCPLLVPCVCRGFGYIDLEGYQDRAINLILPVLWRFMR